jgi:glycosyltransferase involved in cell wall biosynthesis
MVARFDAPKRQDLLIEALAVLRDQLGYELPVSLIGDGPDYDRCQAIASRLGLRSIVFAGDVNDVPKRLAEHSIFVLISDHEGMPISIIEAMRAGLCIVASDLPGIRELVTHEKTALLVPNKSTALATALRRLEKEPALRQLLSQAARLRYAMHYKSDQTAGAVMQLYKELSGPQRAVDFK